MRQSHRLCPTVTQHFFPEARHELINIGVSSSDSLLNLEVQNCTDERERQKDRHSFCCVLACIHRLDDHRC